MKIKKYNNHPPIGAKQQELYWKIIEEFSATIGRTKEGFLDFKYNDETRNFINHFVDEWIPFPFEYMVMTIISFSPYYLLHIPCNTEDTSNGLGGTFELFRYRPRKCSIEVEIAVNTR